MRTGATYARWTMVLVALAASVGCYDGGTLVKDVRSAALRNRLAEVDLGSFRTTMPRNEDSLSFAELELHIFGTVPHYRVPAIEQQLRRDGFRLRHEMLAAVRRTTDEELVEPNFTQLRARIEQVVNDFLDNQPVRTVGFYDVRIFHL